MANGDGDLETCCLSEETLSEVERVVLDRFPASALDVLSKIMKNPSRKIHKEAGFVVYDKESPVCFEAMILRRLYWGSQFVWGCVGGMTCIKKGAAPEALIDLKRAIRTPTEWNRISFANSQNAESAHISRKTKSLLAGPESCTRYLWRAVRPLACLAYFARRKLLKAGMPAWKGFSTLGSAGFETRCGELAIRRVMEVKSEFYDVLMKRYLETNKGLVCSRTAEEIDWIFGERIRRGETVVLGAFDAKGPCGYILMTGGEAAKRWQIHDWFAVRNDMVVLEMLLGTACRFLKKQTPAMMLEVSGFPMFAQALLKKYLPHIRQLGHNAFSCGSKEAELREKLREMVQGDLPCWFFGPYDGDICF